MSPKKNKKKKTAQSNLAERIRAKRNLQALGSVDALNLAIQYHKSRNLHRAEQIYRQLLLVHPNNVPVLYRLGLLLSQVGKSKECVQLLNKAIKQQPDFAAGYNSLGVVMQEQGNFSAAEENYRKAHAIQPDFAEAVYNFGNIL